MSNSAEDAELLMYAINAAKEAKVRIPNASVETDRVQAERIFQLIDKATIGFLRIEELREELSNKQLLFGSQRKSRKDIRKDSSRSATPLPRPPARGRERRWQ